MEKNIEQKLKKEVEKNEKKLKLIHKLYEIEINKLLLTTQRCFQETSIIHHPTYLSNFYF